MTGRARAGGPTDDDDFPDEAAEASARGEFEALLSSVKVPRNPDPGSVVSGTVVQVGEEDVFLDIGAKSEAAIARDELVDAEGRLEVQVGDRVEASVLSLEGGIRLSRKLLKSAKSRAALEQAFAARLAVEGRVESVRKGGFEVTLAGGARAFCPLSQIDERRTEDPQAWVGRSLEFRILEMGERGRNLVVSRRRLLEEESAKKAEETRAGLAEGAVVRGRVASLQGYGAFVDLGGVQGLLHVSEIAHHRVSHPSEVLKPGDEVTVKVLKIDPVTNKISLGMKQLADDPWATVAERIRPGQRLDARVSRAAEFGAFVELEPGIEGLLHVSELAPGKKAQDARKLVQAGEGVRVKVLEVDLERRRISLARVEGDEPEAELAPGALVRGRVDRVEGFGVFVRVGPGQVGLVPNEELGAGRAADPRREFPPGSEMVVEVLAVEEGGRRIRLSRSRALDRDEREEVDRFRAQEGERRGFSTLGDALRGLRKG